MEGKFFLLIDIPPGRAECSCVGDKPFRWSQFGISWRGALKVWPCPESNEVWVSRSIRTVIHVVDRVKLPAIDLPGLAESGKGIKVPRVTSKLFLLRLAMSQGIRVIFIIKQQ